MTEKQIAIIEFIKAGEYGKRYLCEFEEIIPVKSNKQYQWQVRGSILGKMVKSGLIKRHFKGKQLHRQTIYYYL